MNPQEEPTKGREPQKVGLDWARGLGYAFALGIGGFVATSIILQLYGCWVPKQIFIPSVGVMFALAGTGWAAFAPRGRYGIAWTLAIIFAVSVSSWIVLAIIIQQHHGVQEKVSDQPLIYPSELLFLALPPLAAAVVLSLLRRNNNPAD